MPPRLPDVRAIVAPILRRHGVRRAGVFGSVATGTAGPESDVDILVELPPAKNLLDIVALKRDLEAALGTRVDVVEYTAVHPLLRDTILAEQVAVL